MKAGAGDILMPSLHHHLVNPAHTGFTGPAEAAGHACEVLEFQRDVFEDVCRPGSLLQAPHKPARFAITAAVLGQGWQPCAQPFHKAGDRIGRAFFEFADIHPRLQHGPVGPEVGATKGKKIEKPDVFACHETEVPRCGNKPLSFRFPPPNQAPYRKSTQSAGQMCCMRAEMGQNAAQLRTAAVNTEAPIS